MIFKYAIKENKFWNKVEHPWKYNLIRHSNLFGTTFMSQNYGKIFWILEIN